MPRGEADDLELIRTHVFPRGKATVVGVLAGVVLGFGNAALGVVFPSWAATAGLLLAALVLVVVLHEGLHGLASLAFGYRPIFGVEPPLVFTTFDEKLDRDHLIVVALAPLLVLDAAFAAGYLWGPWPAFWNLCFAVNTIGSVGDCWITLRLLGHEPGTLIRDTTGGFEAWARR